MYDAICMVILSKFRVTSNWIYFSTETLIFPLSMCQKPCMSRPHCRPKAAKSRLTPTLLKPYLFRKVIRKPNPMKIITWTSWNTGDRREARTVQGHLTERSPSSNVETKCENDEDDCRSERVRLYILCSLHALDKESKTVHSRYFRNCRFFC